MPASVEELQAEVEQLKSQLARKAKSKPIEFLGESLSADVLPELAAVRKLSALAVKSLPIGMHGDGGNLWLQVTPGGRSWVFRYRWGAKQREMGLGAVADVSLAEARGRATICRRLVREGVDPISRRRALSANAALEGARRVTFKQAAEQYIKAHSTAWKNAKHAAQWPSTLESYVFPVIGELNVQDVDIGLVMKVLDPIWNTKPETASRVRGRLETVLDWATARGLRSGDNPARWRGHMDKLLPARSKAKAVKHHAALPWPEMNSFWRELAKRGGAGAEALRFAVLTGARTSEVTGATWAEVDLAARVWAIPAARMKAGREHRIPLSAEAITVLERIRPLASEAQPYIFPGGRAGKSLSNNAMLMLLKKMGRADLTTHGFRSAFRDWAAESTAYAGDLVEMALAHTIGNKVEAAYRRGNLFEKRQRLMEDWARHCTSPRPAADNVVAIR